MRETDRLLATTFSTCWVLGERARRLWKRETHLRWKEGEMTTKLVQSVSAIFCTVPVLAVTSLICSWVRSGSMVTKTASVIILKGFMSSNFCEPGKGKACSITMDTACTTRSAEYVRIYPLAWSIITIEGGGGGARQG